MQQTRAGTKGTDRGDAKPTRTGLTAAASGESCPGSVPAGERTQQRREGLEDRRYTCSFMHDLDRFFLVGPGCGTGSIDERRHGRRVFNGDREVERTRRRWITEAGLRRGSRQEPRGVSVRRRMPWGVTAVVDRGSCECAEIAGRDAERVAQGSRSGGEACEVSGEEMCETRKKGRKRSVNRCPARARLVRLQGSRGTMPDGVGMSACQRQRETHRRAVAHQRVHGENRRV